MTLNPAVMAVVAETGRTKSPVVLFGGIAFFVIAMVIAVIRAVRQRRR